MDILFELFSKLSSLQNHLAVAEWLRAWDTLTIFEATVCGREFDPRPGNIVG